MTTRPRGFKPYRPQARAAELIEAVQRVLDEYADFLPLTLRQIFYRLVGVVLNKTEIEYKRLIETMNMARRGRLIPMDAIRDDGADIDEPYHFTSAADFLDVLKHDVDTFRLDRQAGQSQHLEVWCEAQGMMPQLARVAHEYGVSVRSAGGFDSLTVKYESAQRLQRFDHAIVLHIGDHDPSGEHIFNCLSEDVPALAEHDGDGIEFLRLAVTPEQIREYSLPTSPPKRTDGRSFSGSSTTQAEALAPADLADIIRAAIEARFDMGVYRAVLDNEVSERAWLKKRLRLAQ